MNNELLNISLNQGKKFNFYQKKIKNNIINNDSIKKQSNKEGFVSSTTLLEQEQIVRPSSNGYIPVLKNMEQTTMSIHNIDNKDLEDLKNLQTKYDDLIKKYNDIQKKIGDSSMNTINRLNSNNPYLGKNVLFTNGTKCYVTNQGIAKPYTSDEIFKNNSGKNGCPKDLINLNIPWSSEYIPGATIPTNPPLIVGPNMTMGESCGYEGINIYASKLTNNPNSSYIGCYNDKPQLTSINVVPIMNSSNSVNGFTSRASSIYMNSNSYGPWAAFDQNPKSMWHSSVSASTSYDSSSGIYKGNNSVNIVNVGRVKGEFLQIDMPGFNTSSAQKQVVNQYSLIPRSDLFTTRSPNSWYVLGWNNNQWFQVDRQQKQRFTSANQKVYNIAKPDAYSSYILLIDKVGNDDQKSNRTCVQVAEWNLFTNSSSNDEKAMTETIGYTSFDKCQEYALENSYKYFGLQDLQPDGNAACVVSNDIIRTKVYGNVDDKTSAIPIWSSNTAGSGATNCYISVEGKLLLNDPLGNILWESSNSVKDCLLGGNINRDSLTATYGANCNNNNKKKYNVVEGNATTKVKSLLDPKQPKSSLQINIGNKLFGDPAGGCNKSYDTAYQCGTAWKSSHINNSEGQSFLYDCEKETQNCVFFLNLQTDGNICLNRGSDTSNNKGIIWCSNTAGKQKFPNPEWEAKNGKFGRNYLKLNESLNAGDWIGSDNGSIKLIMQSDGNLVLYASETTPGCKVVNNTTYGTSGINAVYELDDTGNRSTLGKIGYVDSESKLREYPDSMVGFTNDYQIFQNTDSTGNDISTLSTTDKNACQSACNNNPDCAAFVYQGSSQTCWLKNKSAYPRGKKQENTSTILGVRTPSISKNGSITCSNKIVNVDTIQYDNYLKGSPMDKNTQCNQSIVSNKDLITYNNIISELQILGQDISNKMESLYNQDNKIYEKLNINEEQFKIDLENYKQTNLKINRELPGINNLQSNNIEGMITMSDLNGMLTDSDLIVLQENYSYIMWSILAVGLVTVTINSMKK